MSATQLQLRRDTFTNLSAATPASGEIGIDTTNKRAVVGNGLRAGGFQIPNFSDLQKQVFTYAVAGGTGNAITLAYTFPTLADVDGLELGFKATANNTGAVTIATDGRSAITGKKIKDGMISNLEAGDIISGGYYKFCKVGSYYMFGNLKDTQTQVSGLQLLQIFTGGGSSYDMTGEFDSNFRNYGIKLENIMPSSNDTNLLGRVRRAGQGSFDSTFGNYVGGSSGLAFQESIGNSTQGNSSNYDSTYIHLFAAVANSVGYGVSGWIWLDGFAQSNGAYITHDLTGHYYFLSGGNNYVCARTAGGHVRSTTSALDGFQLKFLSGSIASGNAYVFGVNSNL